MYKLYIYLLKILLVFQQVFQKESKQVAEHMECKQFNWKIVYASFNLLILCMIYWNNPNPSIINLLLREIKCKLTVNLNS